MKTTLHLIWLAVSVADIAAGYFIIWDWANTPDLAVFIFAVGMINAYWAIKGISRPKVIMFNHLKGARYV